MADNAFSRFVFHNQTAVNRTVKAVSLGVSVASICLIAYHFGFPQSEAKESFFTRSIQFIFSFYVLSYILKLVFTLDRVGFVKRNWLEGILTVFLFYDVFSLYLFGVPVLYNLFESLGFENFTILYLGFIQFYLLLYVGIDAVKVSYYLSRIKIKTPAIFGMSFILLILVGTFLLMMPEMTTAEGSMGFLDALFTSVSASCVTGLIVVDTATFFTFKGQFIIMLLFQIGGIGIISFALFFALFLRSGVGIQSQNTLKEMLNTASLVASRKLLKQVIALTFLIEAIGALLLYSLMGDVIKGADRVFFAIFHSVSAFCNAGFSLFSNGMYEEIVRNKHVMHLVIAAIIFFGSLGFPAIQDLFGIKNLRERMKHPWKDWHLSTKISLYSSVILVVFGAVAFYFLEINNTLEGSSAFGQVTNSIFQSVTTRTAGFNTLDFSALATPTLVMMILLMFIGASSASTGGGIKTSTFVVIFLSVFATIRNRRNIELAGRTLSTDLLNRALTIFIFAASYVFIAVFILSITDPQIPILDTLFETVSAFCTVGISTGVTAEFSTAGRVILMLSMYLGRVGILTLVVALSSAASKKNYTYPQAHLMIG